jgi:hypothetical protein
VQSVQPNQTNPKPPSRRSVPFPRGIPPSCAFALCILRTVVLTPLRKTHTPLPLPQVPSPAASLPATDPQSVSRLPTVLSVPISSSSWLLRYPARRHVVAGAVVGFEEPRRLELERKVWTRGRRQAIAAAVMPRPGSTVDQMATSVLA